MLTVDYNAKIGYYKMEINENDNIRVYLCKANCLWAEIEFDDKPRLWGFAYDIEHLKRCAEKNIYEKTSEFVFDSNELTHDLWKAIKILTRNGKTVTIKSGI